jgi:hypothetical protein
LFRPHSDFSEEVVVRGVAHLNRFDSLELFLGGPRNTIRILQAAPMDFSIFMFPLSVGPHPEFLRGSVIGTPEAIQLSLGSFLCLVREEYRVLHETYAVYTIR